MRPKFVQRQTKHAILHQHAEECKCPVREKGWHGLASSHRTSYHSTNTSSTSKKALTLISLLSWTASICRCSDFLPLTSSTHGLLKNVLYHEWLYHAEFFTEKRESGPFKRSNLFSVSLKDLYGYLIDTVYTNPVHGRVNGPFEVTNLV